MRCSIEFTDSISRVSFTRFTRHAYALRVKGDNMMNAKIFDEYIAIVEPRTPNPNDVVAALIDGENTLKRLLQQGKRVFLEAEDPNSSPPRN